MNFIHWDSTKTS